MECVGGKKVKSGGSLPACRLYVTLPETNSEWKHLKMDGWKTIVSFWETIFSGAFAVSFREGTRWAPKTSYQWIYWIKNTL